MGRVRIASPRSFDDLHQVGGAGEAGSAMSAIGEMVHGS
jgi:hypothetical protein